MSPEVTARLALVSLPKIGPARAAWLLSAGEGPAVVEALRRGLLPPEIGPAPAGVDRAMVERWGAKLRAIDVDDLISKHRALGIQLLAPGNSRWPFGGDPDPPALLFYKGDLDLLDVGTAIAVVGTRRCTTVGRSVAYQLGADVAIAGGSVVSGLALGVDGAAHRGVLDNGGGAVGVVGSGLDVVYPGGNRSLWQDVAGDGLLLSEAPAGAKPERWRFPARNRLIAALSDGVVIVESHNRGGALLTVDEAIDRGRPVFAIPGSVLSPASDGTNSLLVEGAIPVRYAADVFDHLGVALQAEASPKGPVRKSADVEPGELSDVGAMIMAEVATGPVHLDRLLLRGSVPPAELLAEVQSLVSAGRLLLDGSTVSRP